MICTFRQAEVSSLTCFLLLQQLLTGRWAGSLRYCSMKTMPLLNNFHFILCNSASSTPLLPLYIRKSQKCLKRQLEGRYRVGVEEKEYQCPVHPDQLEGTRKDSIGLLLQCLFDFFYNIPLQHSVRTPWKLSIRRAKHIPWCKTISWYFCLPFHFLLHREHNQNQGTIPKYTQEAYETIQSFTLFLNIKLALCPAQP